jgi:hypothetical protein
MDTDSPSLGAYEGFYLYGRPNFEPSLPRIKLDQAYVKYVGNNAALGLIRWDPRAAENLARMGGLFTNTPFALEPHRPKGTIDAFEWYRIHDVLPARSEPTMILTTTSRQTVLNRSHAQDQRSDAVLMPRDRISNHLVLLNARLGASRRQRIDRTRLFTACKMTSLIGPNILSGRALFALLHHQSTKSFRFVLDLTASLNADGVNALPPAAAVGSRRVRFDSVGRGSARLFSPPSRRRCCAGTRMPRSTWGGRVRFPNRKTGLMRLYGLDYGGDPRRFVGFARNISAISEDEYRSKV